MRMILMILLLLPLSLPAQTNGEVMENVRKIFASEDKAFSMNFAISSETDGYLMAGMLTLQGTRYRIETSELEIYCDGESKWVVYPDYSEAVVMKNNLNAVDFVENPYIVFTAPDEIFNYRSKGKAQVVDGLYRVKMDSRSRSAYDLVIYVNSRFIPEKIELSNDTAEYAVSILQFSEIEPNEKSFYVFSTDNEDFYITDMR